MNSLAEQTPPAPPQTHCLQLYWITCNSQTAAHFCMKWPLFEMLFLRLKLSAWKTTYFSRFLKNHLYSQTFSDYSHPILSLFLSTHTCAHIYAHKYTQLVFPSCVLPKGLSSVAYCSKHFMSIISLNPHGHSMNKVLLSPLFYRWNWGSEFNKLAYGHSQLTCCGVRIGTSAS